MELSLIEFESSDGRLKVRVWNSWSRKRTLWRYVEQVPLPDILSISQFPHIVCLYVPSGKVSVAHQGLLLLSAVVQLLYSTPLYLNGKMQGIASLHVVSQPS